MPSNLRPSLKPNLGQKPDLSRHELVRARPIPKWHKRLLQNTFGLLEPLKRLFGWYFGLKKPFALIIAVVLVASIAGLYYLPKLHKPAEPTGQTGADTSQKTNRPSLEKGTPSYDTLLPENKSIDQLGGWTRISPPDRNPVYAYTDQIGSTKIIVSQQPLPSEFQKDPTALKKFAEDYGAGNETMIDDLKIYSGASTDGPESIVLAKNNLLILIKADKTLPNDSLISYVKSLR